MIIPYVSPQEFADAPTGLNINDLVPNGTQPQESNALMRVLQRASAWIDNVCQMELRATQNTETKRVWVRKEGWLEIYTNYSPILQVVNLSYRLFAQQEWMPLDTNDVEIMNHYFRWTGFRLPSCAQLSIQYTYVNGWAVCMLTQAANAGDNSITLDNTLGVMPNTVMTIYDGANTEQVTVASINQNIVTLNNSLQYAHQAGVHVSSLPDDVRQACIMVASAFIKERRSGSIIMYGSDGRMSNHEPSATGQEDELLLAEEILMPYKRVI
ncbi:hypothetical protein Tsac_2856 [Thermoanaerobacterium phage THSA-485A]|uniref:hypothetical protein n=1 Tax=Thermoanaerobacterium phage THSA-485A TaxID=1126885 RepID=UPI000263F841|nr:hypothetical protein Tsac_2856 [Thermoanaerobacterium phage THSA-485A]AFK87709.1 hypothetical protein Tsac_2856 [Thermoanaerobacterium phage THSA-485A]